MQQHCPCACIEKQKKRNSLKIVITKTPETGHKHNPVSYQVENNHSLIKQKKHIITYRLENDAKLMLLAISQNFDYCFFIRFLHRHQVIKCYPFSVSKRNCSILSHYANELMQNHTAKNVIHECV